MTPADHTFTLGWIGPVSKTGRYLIARAEEACVRNERRFSIVQQPQLQVSELQTADRIILSSLTRSDYPQGPIEQLIQSQLGIPWGVVTGPWHSGSRRSGLGVTTHWSQPWFRWWESWYGWLFPEAARPAALCPTQFDCVTTPLDLASISAGAVVTPGGVVTKPVAQHWIKMVVACSSTGQAWQEMAQHVGWRATMSNRLESLASGETAPHVCLWDDSMLSCLPGVPIENQLLAQLTEVRSLVPNAKLVVGLSLCHLDLWSRLLESGVDEILIKPSHGLPLADYLSCLKGLD